MTSVSSPELTALRESRVAVSAVVPGQPGPDDWKWQLRHSVTTLAELERHLSLTEAERLGALRAEQAGLPLGISPYFLSLCDPQDALCPIRRQVVPTTAEREATLGDLRDPLGEESHEVAPNLIQRYPDRALLLVTDRCAIYCRFCTRSRFVGEGGGASPLARLGPALEYLHSHPEIRDVILSGGDLLTSSTERIVEVVAAVRSIPSVETIRLATRVPSALPQRITAELVEALRAYHPLWVMSHFNHPRELTELSRRACRRLADAGFPVMNQTVLLRGINDSPSVLESLFRGLVRERVRPYYLLQADPVSGTGHLRTPLSRGIELMEALQGRVSGIALPKLIVDTPGGLGKVPVGPEYILRREGHRTTLRTHRGVEADYFDPV